MEPIAVVAIGAESALGSGHAAYAVGAPGDSPRTAIEERDELRAAGLRKPFAAVARASVESPEGEDPAARLLRCAITSVAAELTLAVPGWRTRRVAISLGTSSGGMHSLTTLLHLRGTGAAISRDLARAAPYFGPLSGLSSWLELEPEPSVQVLAACASSAIAIGLGTRWLWQGRADVVLAGGYDAVTPFVAAGFEVLGATSASRPSPFRAERDGMALGEAAVVFALMRPDDVTTRVVGFVRGFGASCDAVHVTAPDREGAGLARAAKAALADAGISPDLVDLVSAHGTATPFNDAAETRALETVLGLRVEHAVVHAFKAAAGHTLGASSALEAAAVLDAMNGEVLPATAGEGTVDPAARVRLLERNLAGRPLFALKLSAAFGGANAALVLAKEAGHTSPRLPSCGVSLLAVGEPKIAADVAGLAGGTRIANVQLSRLDPLSGASVAAAASALLAAPSLNAERTGVIVGTVAATLECNEAFDVALREHGARGAEPRRFPPTSPNLCAGQCSIAFGLKGPSLSVSGGLGAPLEALLVAFDLLEAGDADALVVIAADHIGPVVSQLFEAAEWPCPRDGAIAAIVTRGEGAPLERAHVARALRDPGAVLNDGVSTGWPMFRAFLASLGAPRC